MSHSVKKRCPVCSGPGVRVNPGGLLDTKCTSCGWGYLSDPKMLKDLARAAFELRAIALEKRRRPILAKRRAARAKRLARQRTRGAR